MTWCGDRRLHTITAGGKATYSGITILSCPIQQSNNKFIRISTSKPVAPVIWWLASNTARTAVVLALMSRVQFSVWNSYFSKHIDCRERLRAAWVSTIRGESMREEKAELFVTIKMQGAYRSWRGGGEKTLPTTKVTPDPSYDKGGSRRKNGEHIHTTVHNYLLDGMRNQKKKMATTRTG